MNVNDLEAIIECKETDAEQTDALFDTDDIADLVDFTEGESNAKSFKSIHPVANNAVNLSLDTSPFQQFSRV